MDSLRRCAVTWISSIAPVSVASAVSAVAAAANEDPAYPLKIAEMAYASLWLVFNRLSQENELKRKRRQNHPAAAVAAENFSRWGVLLPFPARPPWHPAASTFNAAFY